VTRRASYPTPQLSVRHTARNVWPHTAHGPESGLFEGETGRVGHFPSTPLCQRRRVHQGPTCVWFSSSRYVPSRSVEGELPLLHQLHPYNCPTDHRPLPSHACARPTAPAPALPVARLPQQHSPPRQPLAPGVHNRVVPPLHVPSRRWAPCLRSPPYSPLSVRHIFPPKLLRSGFSHQEPADPWYVAPYQEQDPCSRAVRLPSRRPGKAGASQLARNSISSASLHRGAKTRCAPALRLGQQVATASHRGTTSSSAVRARPAQPQPVQHHEHADIAP